MHFFLKSIDEIFNFIEKKIALSIFLLIFSIFFISYIIFDLIKIDLIISPLYVGGFGILISLSLSYFMGFFVRLETK